MNRLTIYASRPGITDPSRMFPEREEYGPPFHLHFTDNSLGLLYPFQSGEGPPDWAQYLNDGLEDEELPLRSTSASAVLLVQRQGRLFAVTFGYAWQKIEDAVLDQRFGLRAALNAVRPGAVRSIDRQTFDEIHRQAREQSAYATDLEVFGLDAERDLLRSITGVPDDPDIGSRLSGRDRITVVTDTDIEDLPVLLDRLLAESERDAYTERYPSVDNIAEVRSSTEKEKLNHRLAATVRRGELDRIWLAPPVIVDWDRIGGFQYKTADVARTYPDLAWSDYFSEVRSADNLEAKHLSNDAVFRLDADRDEILGRWSLGRCVIAEIEVDGSVYVHTDRNWYRVSQTFARFVHTAVEGLNTGSVDLPPFNDPSETAYNERAVDESDGYLALMHEVGTIYSPGNNTGVEFCDLYGRGGEFIHVKQFGRSRKLSHLFSQGAVSARATLADQAFRTEVNDELPASHAFANPTERIQPREFEVNYAIISPRGRALELPFFSKVNLKNAADLLQSFGFEVTFTSIENQLD